MLRLYRLRDYNFRLVIWLILLSVLGVILVSSADPSLRGRQIFGVIVGIAAMILLSLIDYSWILNFYWLIYLANLGLLLAVVIMGLISHGAARWIAIGGENGLIFQPTELSKILLILFFAMYLMKHENDLNTAPTILKAVILMAIPIVLVARQPDLKNASTLTNVFCILMYIAG